jgi:hypothetical protein
MVGDGIDGIDGESVIAGMVEAPQEALGIEGPGNCFAGGRMYRIGGWG